MEQPPGASTGATTTTNQSSGNAGSVVSSITISEGSAAQQVKVYYQPNPSAVFSGSKVTWTNKDIAPHTATSGLNSSAADSGKIFDTGLISPDQLNQLLSVEMERCLIIAHFIHG